VDGADGEADDVHEFFAASGDDEDGALRGSFQGLGVFACVCEFGGEPVGAAVRASVWSLVSTWMMERSRWAKDLLVSISPMLLMRMVIMSVFSRVWWGSLLYHEGYPEVAL